MAVLTPTKTDELMEQLMKIDGKAEIVGGRTRILRVANRAKNVGDVSIAETHPKTLFVQELRSCLVAVGPKFILAL